MPFDAEPTQIMDCRVCVELLSVLCEYKLRTMRKHKLLVMYHIW